MNKTLKQFMLEQNIIFTSKCCEYFFNGKGRTITLLNSILGIRWKLSDEEDGKRYIDGTFQTTQDVLYDIYNELKSQKIHVHNFYNGEDGNITVRLNLFYDTTRNEFYII